jgi:type I restriction enzyme S subunit
MAGHDLPAGWKLGTLEDVLEICDSGIWGQPGSRQDFPILRSTNIHNGTMVLQEVAFRKVIRNPERYVLKNGDILVTKSSGSRDLIGKCCMFTDPNDGKRYLFSNFTQRLRVNEKMLPEYLFYFLVSDCGKRNLARLHETTSGLRNLDMKRYVKQELPVPPIEAQKRIVQLLKRADALRHRREQANQLTGKIIQSVFLKMFGDPATNPKGWEITTIGNHATIRYGTGSPPPYEMTGIPFVRATNIKMGKIVGREMRFISAESAQQIEKCRLREGNLLIVRSGVNTGDCACVTREYDGAYAAYDLILDFDEQLDNRFVWAILNMPYGRRIMKPMTVRAAQPHLNAGQVSSINVPKPPVELQQRYSTFVEKLDTLNERQMQSTHEISELFNSLMKKAFSGELSSEIPAEV